MKYYKLDENDFVVECMTTNYDELKRIAKDKFYDILGNEYYISTQFFGRDMRSIKDHAENPLVFETMVFFNNSECNFHYTRRSCCKEEALRDHKDAVEAVMKIIERNDSPL